MLSFKKLCFISLSSLFSVTLLFLETPFSQLKQREFKLDCKHIAPIEQIYFSRHITFSRSSSSLEARTVRQFIEYLDPKKIYLLKEDIRRIEKLLSGIYKKVRAGQCSPIEKAYALYQRRVDERLVFVRTFLGNKFIFKKKTRFVFDPDSRDYPKTKNAAQNLIKNYIQLQVANYLASGIPLAEAKKNVIKNYERLDKRVDRLSKEDLWSSYLSVFSRSLDPHSSYLSADDLEDFEIQMRLSLEGIGATLSSKDGFTVIEQLIPGGSAERSGKLKSKDKIVAVGQGVDGPAETVMEMDLREVVGKIRGKKGSKVRLTLLRKEGKGSKRFEVTLVRDKIKLEDEAAQVHYFNRKVNGKSRKIALLNLPSFYSEGRLYGRSAAKDVDKLLAKIRAAKADGIVFDLSTNGGGSLKDAVEIAGMFFRTGNVVKQSNRDPSRGEIVLADRDKRVQWTGPLVILISRVSASASEIVAGTLKDYKRAIIVGGDHTFGKGSVQSVESVQSVGFFPPGLGAIKTTVGMFFTPGGFSTQHRGVTSDISFPSAYSTDEVGEKTLDYSLPPKKIASFLSSSAQVTSGVLKWQKVTPRVIQKLKVKSQARVKKNKDFKEIVSNLKKAKERKKMIYVSDVFEKDKDEKSKKDKSKKKDDTAILSRKEKTEKYLKRADIQEAVNIMADYLSIHDTKRLTLRNQ